MKKKTNLTIVIVTYLTNRKILLDCLKSIDKNFKVIIVENSKQFKDKKFFLKKFNNIEIVCTGLNLGYGKGNNFGLEKVQTDYALILNPDVVCKNDFFDKQRLCTMQSSTQYCQLPGRYGYKWPTLTELHNILFGRDFEDAHDAAGDINATENCFWKLKELRLL